MQDFIVQVISKKFLARNIVELSVRLIKPRRIKFRAGQFVLFKIGGAFKAYSITSLPDNNSELRFLIKLEPNGRASEFVRNVKIGGRFDVSGPAGEFIVRSRSRPLVCLATGIGLAPFLSIIPQLLKRGFAGNVSLVYGGHAMPYRKQWEVLSRQHRNFKLHPLVNHKVEDWLRQNAACLENALLYVCGSRAAVESIMQALTELGAADESIHTEFFL